MALLLKFKCKYKFNLPTMLINEQKKQNLGFYLIFDHFLIKKNLISHKSRYVTF